MAARCRLPGQEYIYSSPGRPVFFMTETVIAKERNYDEERSSAHGLAAHGNLRLYRQRIGAERLGEAVDGNDGLYVISSGQYWLPDQVTVQQRRARAVA